MTWVTIDDKMPEHPKVWVLSDGAFRLHISAISYCNRYLTDGLLPSVVASRLVPKFRQGHLDELLSSGSNGAQSPLWLTHGDSYEIRDFLDWNLSRAEVEGRRERISKVRSEAGRKGAAARWHKR